MRPHTDGLSDQPFQGFQSPNGTIVPDELFDVLMPQLTEAELRVCLYIVRRTFGFKKSADDISLTQMVEGITTADGRVLDRGTGLSKATVARGLAGLRQKGIILAVRNRSQARGDEATTYRLRFISDPPCLSGETPPPVSPVRHPVSHQRDTQTTVRQTTGNISNIRKAHAKKINWDGETDEPASGRVAGSDESSPATEGIDAPPAATPALEASVTPESHPVEPSTEPTGEGYQRLKEVASQLRHRLKEQPQPSRRQRRSSPVPLGAILRDRQEPPEPPAPVASPTESDPASLPTRRRGRPPGSREERDHLSAYLSDFSRELGDQAPLGSSITRALNLFKQANVPPPKWSQLLYQARSITQERSGQIKAKPVSDPASLKIVPKPKMGYFFAVLADLLGLKDEPDNPTEPIRTTKPNEDKTGSTARRIGPTGQPHPFGYPR